MIFLKPLKIILAVYIVGGLGLAADITTLTNFNLINLLKNHSPQSYYVLLIATLILYIALVFTEYFRNKQIQPQSVPDHNFGQIIRTRNVKNSTIIQIRKDKEE